jgi:hypothetical protein
MVNRNRSSRFHEFSTSLRWLFAETRYLVIVLATISFGAALGAPNSPAPIAGTPGYVPAKDNLGVISGTVESEKGPVAGATVLIVSAKPLYGPQILEPICYPNASAIRIEEDLGAIESHPVGRIIGSLNPVAVNLPRLQSRHEGMPVVVRAVKSRIDANDARGPGVILTIEEQQLHAQGAAGEHTEIDAAGINGSA